MEFSLIKGQKILVNASSVVYSGLNGLRKVSEKIRYTIEPVTYHWNVEGGTPVVGGIGPSSGETNLCKILENSLLENRIQVKSLKAQKLLSEDVNVLVNMPLWTSVSGQLGDTPGTGHGGIGGVVHVSLDIEDADACIFDRLFERFGLNVTANFEMTDFGQDISSSEKFSFFGKDLAIAYIPNLRRYGIKIEGIQFPGHMINQWYFSKLGFQGVANLSVKMNDIACNHLYLERFSTVRNLKITQTLIRRMPADLKIRGKEGILLPCHKKTFCAKSTEIKKMIAEKLLALQREPVIGKQQLILDFPELSQPGLTSLVDFIYHQDVKTASENCDLALELLQAGSKYNVLNLCRMMTTLVDSKGPDWFSVDMAVRLLCWTRKVETMKGLRKKSVMVLKWYAKSSTQELLNSEQYKQLFHNDPRSAMELGPIFLQGA